MVLLADRLFNKSYFEMSGSFSHLSFINSLALRGAKSLY